MRQLSEANHPIWTLITITLVGGFIIGTLIVTTSKWDSEILLAVATIGGPIAIEYFRRKWDVRDKDKLKETLEIANQENRRLRRLIQTMGQDP